ncbi:MAG: PIN domain-containing protein [Cytophagaceae bacterium]|nr:PIN domain-containing protein [Cytophagaceae bacterium]
MKSFFLDTNILLDLLADRKPFSDQAAIIFESQEQNKINLYVSAISFNNLYYIITKIEGHKTAVKLLKELSDLVTIIPLEQSIIQNSLESSFTDFEDAIQYHSALKTKNIKGIITRNTKDFKKTELPILTPELAIKLIEG